MAKEKAPTAEDVARGARLADLRNSRSWSQAHLAEQAGFPDPTGSGRQRVLRLESGYLKFTSPEQQAGYARAFGASVGAILEYARGERTLDDLLKSSSAAQPRPKTGPTAPRRAENERWRDYAKEHPSFGAQATMALAAGAATDWVLDAASDALSESHRGRSPTAAESRDAILAARDGVKAWGELIALRKPGTTPSQQAPGSKGKSTRK